MADGVQGSGAGRRLSLGAPGVRVLVAGSGIHAAGSELPDLPTVGPTARALAATLTARCGLADRQVRVAEDPASPADLAQALHECAAEASDVMVFAYAGHGLVGPNDDLYLAVRSTTSCTGAEVVFQALPFSTVREILAGCRARCIVVILDCDAVPVRKPSSHISTTGIYFRVRPDQRGGRQPGIARIPHFPNKCPTPTGPGSSSVLIDFSAGGKWPLRPIPVRRRVSPKESVFDSDGARRAGAGTNLLIVSLSGPLDLQLA